MPKFLKEVKQIKLDIEQFLDEGKRLFLTTSLQTHSIPLIHIIATLDVNVDVYFINTGFHFVETHAFKNEISQSLDIKIESVESPISKSNQKDKNGFFYYTSDTDYCCHLNKVLPTDKLLDDYDVWISGLRRDQNEFRKRLSKVEKTVNNKLKYHPVLDWNSKMIHQYRKEFNLPEHPLEKFGYYSIGCKPCTVGIENMLDDQNRSGRWHGQTKSECGLHTNLIENK